MQNQHIARIREIIPHLQLNTVEAIDPTSADDVVLVNDQIVFRFLKGERTQAEFANEVGVIDLLRDRIVADLPNPFYAQDSVIAYKKLKGNALNASVYESLREAEQRAVASQLASLLKAIHQAPLSIFKNCGLRSTEAPGCADWLELRANFNANILPRLSMPERHRGVELFAAVFDDGHAFDYEPCLVHGKLYPEHLLFDARSKRIHSVDGFCKAGLGDAALDIALVIFNWNEELVAHFDARYPEAQELMKRARIYVQAFELQRAFVAARSGDLSRFTALLC